MRNGDAILLGVMIGVSVLLWQPKKSVEPRLEVVSAPGITLDQMRAEIEKLRRELGKDFPGSPVIYVPQGPPIHSTPSFGTLQMYHLQPCSGAMTVSRPC